MGSRAALREANSPRWGLFFLFWVRYPDDFAFETFESADISRSELWPREQSEPAWGNRERAFDGREDSSSAALNLNYTLAADSTRLSADRFRWNSTK